MRGAAAVSLVILRYDSEYKARQRLKASDLDMDDNEARLVLCKAREAVTRQHNCGRIKGRRIIVKYGGGDSYRIEIRS